ncbi:hypothetical protein DID88_002093 [Monilinia fructigena]|uniref:Cytochrome P450 n=1 Tax=Monilinia fructigena TaxID=38457 RepID=A0A395IVM1_9HELO|nr:hypothetical protein DID88_002093 [Monilinia fructigena]
MAIFTSPQPFEAVRIAIIIAFLTFLIKTLYRAYFTPLSKVPGPWTRLFGESFGTLENEQTTQYIEDLEHIGRIGGIRAEFPNIFAIGKILRIPFLQNFRGRMLEYGSIAVRNAKSQSHATPTFSAKLLEKVKRRMLMDTTAITLTYLIYNILRDRDLQKRLEDEVDTLGENFESKDVERLEFLNAVMEEGLRLWGRLQEVSLELCPKNGVELDGYFVPGDITISTKLIPFIAIPKSSQNLKVFRPERYLPSNKSSQSSDFKIAIMPSVRVLVHALVFTSRGWKWVYVSLYSSETARAQGLH